MNTDKIFPSRSMATLRNKRKLAAVSREMPEGSRSSRGQNVLDPELTQDYISQVSEEIEGRVIKKLSKEFSKRESRILGSLSKLDEFLLNPQVRTCSVAVPGTSRNANSENRETNGGRSSDDPYPEVGYFPHHSGQPNSPEAETNMVTENYPHTLLPTNIHRNGILFWADQESEPFSLFCGLCGREASNKLHVSRASLQLTQCAIWPEVPIAFLLLTCTVTVQSTCAQWCK